MRVKFLSRREWLKFSTATLWFNMLHLTRGVSERLRFLLFKLCAKCVHEMCADLVPVEKAPFLNSAQTSCELFFSSLDSVQAINISTTTEEEENLNLWNNIAMRLWELNRIMSSMTDPDVFFSLEMFQHKTLFQKN